MRWRTDVVVTCGLMAASTALAVPVAGQGTWETTLQVRDLDGDLSNGPEAFYDTTLDVTWLAAGRATTTNWDIATAWAQEERYGLSGWRLPTLALHLAPDVCDFSVIGGTDCGYNVFTKSGDLTQYEAGQTIYSEIAHLWYVTLANKAQHAPGTGETHPPGWGLSNTGDFQNMMAGQYWTDTENGPNSAWQFDTYYGYQDNRQGKGSSIWALALRSGDVLSVPVPNTGLLVILGMGVMFTFIGRGVNYNGR